MAEVWKQISFFGIVLCKIVVKKDINTPFFLHC